MHKNKLESGVHLPNEDRQLKMIFVMTLFQDPNMVMPQLWLCKFQKQAHHLNYYPCIGNFDSKQHWMNVNFVQL